MDPILSLLVQAHGDQLGRMIWGAYRLAATAAEHAQKREEAEAALETLRNGATLQDTVTPVTMAKASRKEAPA